ncbi:hypothetical protein [Myroides injenensis]|uniref:hypothetical protein n=1 Tax=Myroides injenensis TaxID=1183151 RepID=UPI0002881368|nr:hypothetical protein [Myroides injenensis]
MKYTTRYLPFFVIILLINSCSQKRNHETRQIIESTDRNTTNLPYYVIEKDTVLLDTTEVLIDVEEHFLESLIFINSRNKDLLLTDYYHNESSIVKERINNTLNTTNDSLDAKVHIANKPENEILNIISQLKLYLVLLVPHKNTKHHYDIKFYYQSKEINLDNNVFVVTTDEDGNSVTITLENFTH